MTLALASLGALLSQQEIQYPADLWHAASKQLLGNVDVDNSLTRKTDFVKAVSDIGPKSNLILAANSLVVANLRNVQLLTDGQIDLARGQYCSFLCENSQ